MEARGYCNMRLTNGKISLKRSLWYWNGSSVWFGRRAFLCYVLLKNLRPYAVVGALSQTSLYLSYCTISVCHINPKWHTVAFHMKPFSSLPLPFLGRPSVVPRGSRSSGRRDQLKASLKNILTLLHQISITIPPHHLPQGPYWGWRFLRPQFGRRHFPCQKSGSGGWWWNGTSPQ